MGRLVKFKAWDKRNKRFLELEDIDVRVDLAWGKEKNVFQLHIKDKMGFPEETILELVK